MDCYLAGYSNIHPVVAVASKKKLTEKINRRKIPLQSGSKENKQESTIFLQKKRVKKLFGQKCAG